MSDELSCHDSALHYQCLELASLRINDFNCHKPLATVDALKSAYLPNQKGRLVNGN